MIRDDLLAHCIRGPSHGADEERIIPNNGAGMALANQGRFPERVFVVWPAPVHRQNFFLRCNPTRLGHETAANFPRRKGLGRRLMLKRFGLSAMLRRLFDPARATSATVLFSYLISLVKKFRWYPGWPIIIQGFARPRKHHVHSAGLLDNVFAAVSVPKYPTAEGLEGVPGPLADQGRV